MRSSTDICAERPGGRRSVSERNGGTAVAPFSRHARAALDLLLEAYEFARDLQRDVWDFAVEIEGMRNAGVTVSALRWLVCKGLVEHAREILSSDEQCRAFRREGKLRFSRRTAFVLTEAGARVARQAAGPALPRDDTIDGDPADQSGTMGDLTAPTWDRERQELRLAGVVVKQFKVPAANQERILAAFEEEGWPVRIDDPLPPVPDQDPKRRLHDTINSLNRNQRHALLRFLGDGTGQGVRWKVAPPSENGNGHVSCEG